MEKHDIEITMKPVTCGAPVMTVKVDGVDLSMVTTEVTFTHKAGKVPTVTVTMVPDEATVHVIGHLAKKRIKTL